MPTFKQDIKLGTIVPLIKTDDIDKLAITTDRLADGAVTVKKLSLSLQKLIRAATGIPPDTILEIEQVLKDIQTLEDKTQTLEKMIQNLISVSGSMEMVEFDGFVDDAEIQQVGITASNCTVVYVKAKKYFAAQVPQASDGVSVSKPPLYYSVWGTHQEYQNDAEQPVPHSNKIFVDKTTQRGYRWSGSVLVDVSSEGITGIEDSKIDEIWNMNE